jgi:hypothetical protein
MLNVWLCWEKVLHLQAVYEMRNNGNELTFSRRIDKHGAYEHSTERLFCYIAI